VPEIPGFQVIETARLLGWFRTGRATRRPQRRLRDTWGPRAARRENSPDEIRV
jgi:hypothetical protein